MLRSGRGEEVSSMLVPEFDRESLFEFIPLAGELFFGDLCPSIPDGEVVFIGFNLNSTVLVSLKPESDWRSRFGEFVYPHI